MSHTHGFNVFMALTTLWINSQPVTYQRSLYTKDKLLKKLCSSHFVTAPHPSWDSCFFWDPCCFKGGGDFGDNSASLALIGIGNFIGSSPFLNFHGALPSSSDIVGDIETPVGFSFSPDAHEIF